MHNETHFTLQAMLFNWNVLQHLGMFKQTNCKNYQKVTIVQG